MCGEEIPPKNYRGIKVFWGFRGIRGRPLCGWGLLSESSISVLWRSRRQNAIVPSAEKTGFSGGFESVDEPDAD